MAYGELTVAVRPDCCRGGVNLVKRQVSTPILVVNLDITCRSPDRLVEPDSFNLIGQICDLFVGLSDLRRPGRSLSSVCY